MSEKRKVLFLCSRNSCRSQIAEAFLKKYGGDYFEVFSAGIEPGTIHPMAVKVMAEKGIDISNARSKSIGDFLGKISVDYVIIVCEAAGKLCPRIWPNLTNPPLLWPFDDPESFEGDENSIIGKFRELRDSIEKKVKMFVEVLSSNHN